MLVQESYHRGYHSDVDWKAVEEPTLADIDAQQAYAPDGTDLTLIRWMLSMTPGERLDALQGFIDALWKVKGANAEARFSLRPPDAD